MGHARFAAQTGDRRGHDDTAARSLSQHPWDDIFHRQPIALEIDIEHHVPPFLGDVPGQGHIGDAGIADQDVDVPESRYRLLDGGGHRRAITDIGDQLQRLASVFPHLSGGFLQVAAHRQRIARIGKIAADVQRRDIGPLAGHQHGVRPALAARRAGNESDFAFQFAHLPRLSRFNEPRQSVG